MSERLKLLIGYDGSECAAEAIDDLCRAGLPGENVAARVVSIADVLDIPPTDDPKLHPHAADNMRQQVAAALAEARDLAAEGRARVARLFPGWQVDALAETDSPYWGLVKHADQWPADLLVVGSQGRSAVGRLFFGSVSQNAVLYARCSARIGRNPAAARPGGAPPRIVVGWDGSPDAMLAVSTVAQRHWPAGSEARLVTALDPRLATLAIATDPGAGAGGAVIQDVREHLYQRAAAAASQLRSAGLAVAEPVVQAGEPKRVLLEESANWPADVIFVGARGLSRVERVLLGSVSSAVAARAACSVEVVRSRPA